MRRLAVAMCLALTGFAAGLFIASWAGAGQGQGLAGGAIVLGYGLVGALLAAAVTWLLPDQWLTPALKILIVPAVIVAVTILLGYWYSSQQTNKHLQQAYENLPPFTLALEPGPVFEREQIIRFEADGSTREVRFSTPQRTCSGAFSGEHAVEFLTALRSAESVTYRNPKPCADAADANSWTLAFTIKESTAGETHADTRINSACLQRFPALAAPREAVSRLLNEGEIALACSERRH